LQWILSDHLNSASVTANADGTWNSSIQYTAFGEVRASSGLTATKYRYTGQLAQDVLGLDYYVARWLDPLTGHFISADTLLPNLSNSQDFDRYSYGLNSPIMNNDPNGHCPYGILCNLPIISALDYGLSFIGAIDIGGIFWQNI
jgi:RHS repeat-associated protein